MCNDHGQDTHVQEILDNFLSKNDHLFSPPGPWLMNLSPLSDIVDWETSNTCFVSLLSSLSPSWKWRKSLTHILSQHDKFSLASSPAVPYNGCQSCQRRDNYHHRCHHPHHHLILSYLSIINHFFGEFTCSPRQWLSIVSITFQSFWNL